MRERGGNKKSRRYKFPRRRRRRRREAICCIAPETRVTVMNLGDQGRKGGEGGLSLFVCRAEWEARGFGHVTRTHPTHMPMLRESPFSFYSCVNLSVYGPPHCDSLKETLGT